MSVIDSEAWFLYAREDDAEVPARLRREEFAIPELGPEDVLAEPLYGCWQSSLEDALLRRPFDVCERRREPKVIPSSAGVVRVVEVGASVGTVRPGQRAILFGGAGGEDLRKYPEETLDHDAENTMGCLARRMKVLPRHLLPIPDDTRHSLAQWAAFSAHYVTAWSNWELSHGAFRLQVSSDDLRALDVWGWGGGTTLAELQLARYQAGNCVLLSREKRARDAANQLGIDALDPGRFGELEFDEERYRRDARYRSAYQEAEAAFLAEVESRTAGRKVQIFIDMLGAPVYRATLKALSREGVLTTAGGEHATEELRILRALECIQRHQHIFTHGARYSQGLKAVAFAETSGWMPPVDARIYSFGEIPELAADYRAGLAGPFPIFAVNE